MEITKNFEDHILNLKNDDIMINKHVNDTFWSELSKCGIYGSNDIRLLKDNSTSLCVNFYFNDNFPKLLYFTQAILMFIEYYVKYYNTSFMYEKYMSENIDINYMVNRNDILVIFKGGNSMK